MIVTLVAVFAPDQTIAAGTVSDQTIAAGTVSDQTIAAGTVSAQRDRRLGGNEVIEDEQLDERQ